MTRFQRGGQHAAVGVACQPFEPRAVSGDDPEARVRARRALVRLHAALRQLPERRRAAFVLCAVEGLDPREAAEVMGISRNAMRSLLCRARAQLEEMLARHPFHGWRRKDTATRSWHKVGRRR